MTIDEYILSHSDEEGALLSALNRDANVNLLRPRMLSGHLQGRILKMFCRMLRPRRVLEIGTYTGYATLCMAEGLEEIPEGGERCFRCYRLRLEETASRAAEGKFDYFTTTMTISPLKNAEKLNEIGEETADIYQVAFLNSDFKKKNGYKRSIELSREYGLYRQDYCGCEFSLREREKRAIC